jgi:hypothetical protein
MNDRLRHIHLFSDVAQKGLLLLGCGFLAMMAWGTFSAARELSLTPKKVLRRKRPFPFALAVLTAFSIGVGGFMANLSWGDQRSFREMRERSDAVVAEITRAHAEIAKAGEAPSYLIDLMWRDSTGQERVFGPTHVSAKFWGQITTNGVLTIDRTEIYYLVQDSAARPIIAADVEEREFQDAVGVKAGIAFVVFGFLLGGLLAYRVRSS